MPSATLSRPRPRVPPEVIRGLVALAPQDRDGVLERQVARDVPVERVVGARLVGDQVGHDAPPHHLGQDVGGVADIAVLVDQQALQQALFRAALQQALGDGLAKLPERRVGAIAAANAGSL